MSLAKLFLTPHQTMLQYHIHKSAEK